MTDFCEDHEYHYAGDECPFCEQLVGFAEYERGAGTHVGCSHGTVRLHTEDGERVTASTCDIGADDINEDGTVSTPLTGECQMPDRDTFVELVTDPELARIEQEFAESSERLRHLNAIIELHVAQEMILKAEQLRGAVSDN